MSRVTKIVISFHVILPHGIIIFVNWIIINYLTRLNAGIDSIPVQLNSFNAWRVGEGWVWSNASFEVGSLLLYELMIEWNSRVSFRVLWFGSFIKWTGYRELNLCLCRCGVSLRKDGAWVHYSPTLALVDYLWAFWFPAARQLSCWWISVIQTIFFDFWYWYFFPLHDCSPIRKQIELMQRFVGVFRRNLSVSKILSVEILFISNDCSAL